MVQTGLLSPDCSHSLTSLPPPLPPGQVIPEYEHTQALAAEEKVALVQASQALVAAMEPGSLAELRAVQKPPPELEQLLSAVIIIIKSPGADLSWTKGAKRLMANLDRSVIQHARRGVHSEAHFTSPYIAIGRV